MRPKTANKKNTINRSEEKSSQSRAYSEMDHSTSRQIPGENSVRGDSQRSRSRTASWRRPRDLSYYGPSANRNHSSSSKSDRHDGTAFRGGSSQRNSSNTSTGRQSVGNSWCGNNRCSTTELKLSSDEL